MKSLQRFIVLLSVMVLAVMYPPTPIFGQSTFSFSLDANSAAGDQSVTSVNTSADQAVSIQVFGSNIQNANGFGLLIEYDSSQVTYQGFDAGDVLPGTPTVLAQVMAESEPTFVEIGIASLGGQATVSSGLVGTIRFRTSSAFSGTSIALVGGQLNRGGRSENVMLNVRVELRYCQMLWMGVSASLRIKQPICVHHRQISPHQ